MSVQPLIAVAVPGERDWFTIPSWAAVFKATGLSPRILPGVRTATGHPAERLAPVDAPEYLTQAGASARPPYPYRVHRSHLPVIGVVAPQEGGGNSFAGTLLRPHQVVGANFIRARRGTLLADAMRCVDGEAVIKYNRAGATRTVTLAAFHHSWHGGKWRTDIPTKIRALVDGVFHLHDVLDVIDNGQRPVCKLTLASGKTLRLTDDHEVAVAGPVGVLWVPISSLYPGAKVLTNGTPLCITCGKPGKIATYRYARFPGQCHRCTQRWVNLQRADRKETQGTHLSSDGYRRVTGMWDHPRANKYGHIREHILVAEKALGRFLDADEVVHHKNGIRTDNRWENLEVLSDNSAHRTLHGKVDGFKNLDGSKTINGGVVCFIPKEDAVVSVVEDGQAHVYDVVCAEPHRNFVANGIVVHNCGKTPAIMYSHEIASGSMVVVGPVVARAVWHEWAARRFGRCGDDKCSVCQRIKAAVVADGRPSFVSLVGKLPTVELLQAGARVYYLTFAAVIQWSESFDAFGRIGTFVVDEAHLAGVQNRKNVTVQGIRRLNTCAERAVFASGSPMWNMPKGLWPIVDTICPAAFGSFWEYARRYSDARPTAHGWKADGESNIGELEKRLSAIMLRRTWKDIQVSLPPITRSIEYVELTDAEHGEVYKAANELRRAAGLGKAQTVVGNLARLRKLYARAKVSRAVELVEQTLTDGQSCVAWTWHRDVAEALLAELRSRGLDARTYGPLHGQVDQKKREKVLDTVRSANGPRVLIATMGALGTAISLSWATHEVFVELEWTPANIQQAEARPFDGVHPISATFLVADCDPDRRQADALLSKLEAASGLGLRSGIGDVAEVLGQVFGVDAGKTLDDVAALICEGEAL